MSVINKMLRDLDQRRATSLEPGLRAGTRTVPAPPAAGTQPLRRVAQGLSAVGLVAGLGAAGWYLQAQPQPPAPPVAAAPVVAAPPVPAVSAVPAATAASASAPVELPMSAAPVAMGGGTAQPVPASSPMPSPASATAPLLASVPATSAPSKAATPLQLPPAAAKAPVALPSAERTGLQLTPSIWGVTPPVPPKVAATPAPAAVAPVAPEPAVQAQRQQNAAREALVQAQGLYNGGSADAAMALLQDALSVAERASPPAPGAVQLSLVRELARMELAQGRAAAVLELLGRVEPLLVGQADLWAVRANAAQRLGRHQEAVQFYATALQTRPAEQRWLLGSAVSLAALGQLSQAAELAEKARAIGPVSKDVLGYLRQQGVALQDK